MKNFRRLFVAVLLTAVFAVPAWAGDISSPGAPAPGDVHTPGAPTAFGDISTPGFVAIMLALLSLR
jgi:hypothetical protein